jgi:hypothetical protein
MWLSPLIPVGADKEPQETYTIVSLSFQKGEVGFGSQKSDDPQVAQKPRRAVKLELYHFRVSEVLILNCDIGTDVADQ